MNRPVGDSQRKTEMAMNWLTGFHAVEEALAAGGRWIAL